MSIVVGSRVTEPNDPLVALGIITQGIVGSITGDTANVHWDLGWMSPVPLAELALVK